MKYKKIKKSRGSRGDLFLLKGQTMHTLPCPLTFWQLHVFFRPPGALLVDGPEVEHAPAHAVVAPGQEVPVAVQQVRGRGEGGTEKNIKSGTEHLAAPSLSYKYWVCAFFFYHSGSCYYGRIFLKALLYYVHVYQLNRSGL